MGRRESCRHAAEDNASCFQASLESRQGKRAGWRLDRGQIPMRSCFQASLASCNPFPPWLDRREPYEGHTRQAKRACS